MNKGVGFCVGCRCAVLLCCEQVVCLWELLDRVSGISISYLDLGLRIAASPLVLEPALCVCMHNLFFLWVSAAVERQKVIFVRTRNGSMQSGGSICEASTSPYGGDHGVYP